MNNGKSREHDTVVTSDAGYYSNIDNHNNNFNHGDVDANINGHFVETNV